MESKLKIACDELDNFLSSLSQPSSPSPEVHMLSAAVTSTLDSSEAYRCKCSFQIVAEQDNDDFSCVVRENGSICHLPGGIFLPANFRIRKAMKCLMKLLNKRNDIKEIGDDAKSTHTFQQIRENLTSVTFDTSWDEVECLATLHYGPPGLPQAYCETWKDEAQRVCDECQFAQMTGRSKGIKIS